MQSKQFLGKVDASTDTRSPEFALFVSIVIAPMQLHYRLILRNLQHSIHIYT